MLREAIVKANRVVTQSLPGSGSTLTCGVVVGDRLFIGHVGDSRAYLQRDGEAPQLLTHDHSLVNRLLGDGAIDGGGSGGPSAAQRPLPRHWAGRHLGCGCPFLSPAGKIALVVVQRRPLGTLMEDPELWALIDAAPTPQAACLALVESANEAGGTDNISVILVEILGE